MRQALIGSGRILAILAVFSLCGIGIAAETDNVEQERSKLDSLKEQITALSRKLLERMSVVDQLTDELEAQERTMAETNRKIAELDETEKQLIAELDGLKEKKTGLQEKRQRQQQMIALEMASAYKLGSSEPVKLLLNQEDPHKLARIVRYYHYFAEARRKKIEAFADTLHQLAKTEESIRVRQQNLADTRESLNQKLVTIEAERQERNQILARLNASLDSDKARLEKLQQEQQALEALIASLEERIQDLGEENTLPFADVKGKLPWPVKGKVAEHFGSRRAQGLNWTGWLINSEEGTPVMAVHTGRVAFADYLRGQGLMIIIDHGDGYLSLYAHNQVLFRETGDWVQSGDKVALAGNSGGLSESALYFEIRHNGKPLDPKPWLSALN